MRARTFQTIIFSLCILPIGGCGSTPPQQLAAIDQAVTYLQTASVEIDTRLGQIDGIIKSAEAVLQDPQLAGQITADILTGLKQAQAEQPKLLEAKAKADAVLTELRASVDKLKAGGQVDTAQILQLGAQTLSDAGTAVGGQAGGWMKLVGAILLGVLGTGGAGAAVIECRKLGAAKEALARIKGPEATGVS